MKLIQDLGIKNLGNYKKRFGLYECPICKKHFEASTSSVKNKLSTKCKICSSVIKSTKHGMRKTRIYGIFAGIKSRCKNTKAKGYNTYGGRGIYICDEWKNDFMSFYNWAIANGYEDGLSIDRIDVNGNYEPSNCRWTNNTVQARNTIAIRITNSSGYRGASLDKNTNKFRARVGINCKNINIGTFNTAEEAGYAYDKYVIENNLEHTTNGLYIRTK